MKAKHINLIFVAMLFLFMHYAPTCKACYDPLEEFSDGYFRYVVVGEHNYFKDRDKGPLIAIIGFTELGLQQEIIDIPREIDGKPVMFIGYWDRGLNRWYKVDGGNIKKIYVYDNSYWSYNYVHIRYFVGKETDIMCCYPVVHDGLYGDGLYVESKNMYCYGSLIGKDELLEEFEFSAANVVFINNYSTEDNYGYCGLDNVKEGEKIHEPFAPERSGYEFTGWYTEPECENLWDFDTVPVIEDDSEFRLYASWREI
ncbi:MAG: InlB B-repeat-containing protein [Clostridia bacterium]|nr:InlB B-repeat-containing protein [Clostridia bacterium]